MESLVEYVRTGFDGILVFGDVHGDYDSIKRAYDYAVSENFFFMSLGDLVDRSHMPFETVKLMHDVVQEGRGSLIIGNHDDKFYQYATGETVRFSTDAKQTLVDVGPAREREFLDMYVALMESRFSALYLNFDDFFFVHAAAHSAMFHSTSNIRKEEVFRYLTGETNGQRQPDGFPVRLYNWVNDIPKGKTVLIGHDRTPYDYTKLLVNPKEVINAQDGRVIFMDTGCGKGGHLSGAVIMPNKKGRFEFVEYKEFK